MTYNNQNNPVRIEKSGSIAVIVIDNPPVNAGSLTVRKGILDAVTAFAQDSIFEAAILIGAGKTFIAGSDIREFGKPLADPQLPAVISAIESCAKPVIAALHGAALGGGFELALGCDARIAAPGTLVGLPEVKLGIIPGAGGTQRVPRLIGTSAAIELITAAHRIPAEKALQLGLIDAIADSDLRDAAITLARSWTGKKRHVGEMSVPEETPETIEIAAQAALKKGKRRPAVVQAIKAIRDAAALPFKDGLAAERQAFQDLRASEEAAALRHLFFAERAVARVPGLKGIHPRQCEFVGVVGAGNMGVGIALTLADSGIAVTLVEKNAAVLERGLERAKTNYARAVSSGRITQAQADKRQSLITRGTDLNDLTNADLVIEAVFEDMAVKQDLLRQLDAIVRPGAILASNTSYLDLNILAQATARPGDIVGLHFFSPANIMRLLEIVQGAATGLDVLATALALGKRLGKVPVVAQVCEGFIGNRIYYAYRNQCEFMLEEGAYPEQVDAALEEFGFAMGPFAVGDLSGLDIAWNTRKRHAATRDPRVRYPDILDRLCEAGNLGQKTGQGWYRYEPQARRGVPYDDARALIEDASARKGLTRRAFTAQEIIARALGAIINESALVLSEGIAQRPSDIDLVMVNGYGFPDYRGGPLFWASQRPQQDVKAAIDAVQDATGFGFCRGDIQALFDRMTHE